MYTANTMASAIEAMGFTLPNNSSTPATSEDKKKMLKNAGRTVLNLLKHDLKPSRHNI
jgi:dihydroxy-acid dehydratase